MTGNGYSRTCLTFDPMDFGRFEDELTGSDYPNCCCCDLCNAVAHAVSLPLGDRSAPTIALYDALLAGKHVFRSWDEWAEQLPAGSSGRGHPSSGGVMMDGLGVGVTLGGVTGSKYRSRRADHQRRIDRAASWTDGGHTAALAEQAGIPVRRWTA
ncbi:hypothetical protein [Streptomyces sp. WAC05858]|uniref:hypothetical protein n=1 Tax=Streptomyces TaxID=1883 RepID=UPI000F789B44|nr:hypothetical protein [Streptomyces sp. WAC05858]RSS39438.1 hypothetical protein EF902_27510 [Streptomyces sp. WAC05858]